MLSTLIPSNSSYLFGHTAGLCIFKTMGCRLSTSLSLLTVIWSDLHKNKVGSLSKHCLFSIQIDSLFSSKILSWLSLHCTEKCFRSDIAANRMISSTTVAFVGRSHRICLMFLLYSEQSTSH